MKRAICFSYFLFSLTSPRMYAQDSVAATSKNRYAYVDVGVGLLNTNLSSVNSTLTQSGLKAMNENFATLSLSSGFFFNRFLIRDELTVLLRNNQSQTGNINTSFGGYTLGVGIGYAVIQKPGFRLTPYVGINAFATQLKFEDKTAIADMNDVITGSHRNARISFSNASLDVGLQVEKMFRIGNKKWECPQSTKFMTLGVRLGYHIGTDDIVGRYNGTRITENPPTYSMSGPYLKLSVGFGSKLRELNWKK